MATVLRDKYEKDIPISSTLNRKNSNIFGSFTNNFSNIAKLDYDFAIDNDFNTFEYNSIGVDFFVNNFVTEFNFIEKKGLWVMKIVLKILHQLNLMREIILPSTPEETENKSYRIL